MPIGIDPILKYVPGVTGAVRTVRVQDGESWVLTERLSWPDGTLFTQAVTGTYGVVDVSIRVYDENSADPNTAIYAPSNLATTAVLFAALQTDGYWTIDATGYNFRHTLAYDAFDAHGGHTYRVEYIFNPHSGNSFGPKILVFRVAVEGTVTV